MCVMCDCVGERYITALGSVGEGLNAGHIVLGGWGCTQSVALSLAAMGQNVWPCIKSG